MNTLLRCLKAALMVAGVFALVAIGAFFVQARIGAEHASASVQQIATDVNAVRNGLVGQDGKGGLLAQASALTLKTNLTETEQSLYWAALDNHVRKVTLPALDGLIHNTDASLNDRTGLLNVAGNAIALDALKINETAEVASNSMQQLAENSEPALREMTEAAHGLEQRINDPANAKMQANMEAMTESLLETGGNVNAISKDVRQEVHSYTHPSVPIKVFDGVTRVLGVAGNWFAGKF